MKKLINKNFLNLDLISQTFNIKKENIIGMIVDNDYFKIVTKRRIKNGCNSKYNFTFTKSTN